MPLQLFRGEKEPYGAFLGNASRWAARDGAEQVIVLGAAHDASQDAPDFVSGRIGVFVAGIAG